MACFATSKAFALSTNLLAGSVAVVLLATAAQSPAQASETWPAQVNATYQIAFNGFDIGSFEFNSSVYGKTYVLSGNARVSALLGVFKWSGVTRSAGKIHGLTPAPDAYNFDFRSGNKGGSIKMSFKSGKITNVSAVPPSPARGTVPVKPQHLRGVMDPLSAVMAMSKVKGDDPCARRLPIFDGKQRFDLVLSYAGNTRISGKGGSSVGYVCSVRYVPIAGYQPNAATKSMANTTGMKIILRPIAKARLLVPHKIIIPTIAGSATLTARQVTVTTRDHEQIALVN